MSWKLWQDDDFRPVQWKTREPVRPKLHEDGGVGWMLPRLGRDESESWSPGMGDWLAGAVGLVLLAVLWALAAAF